MKIGLIIIAAIFSLNAAAQDPSASANGIKNANPPPSESIKQLVNILPTSRQLETIYVFRFYIYQDKNSGKGDAKIPLIDLDSGIPKTENPFELYKIITKEGSETKIYEIPYTKIATNIPITTETTQDGGCMYIGAEKICSEKLKKSQSIELNALKSIYENLINIDFIKETKIDFELIKKAAKVNLGQEFDDMNIIHKSSSYLKCSFFQISDLKCTLTLGYIVNIK